MRAYYIYFTDDLIEVHDESGYCYLNGMYHVALSDPIISIDRHDTDERSQEFFARLDELLAIHREEQSSSQ